MSTPHIEDLLPAAIRAEFDGVRVVTETPAGLVAACPLVQVTGIGGSGDQYQFDAPRVDLDVFDVERGGKTARENARDLAQSLHDWLLQALPGQQFGETFVLSVSEFSSPSWTPYENTTVRRFVLSVGLRLHTRSAA